MYLRAGGEVHAELAGGFGEGGAAADLVEGAVGVSLKQGILMLPGNTECQMVSLSHIFRTCTL